MSAPRIALLIINWNGADDTIELLRSLRGAAALSVTLQASVVDNASDAADIERLSSFVHNVDVGLPVGLIRNRVNVGVPAAYNQAIQAIGPDFDAYLRLDNDVVLQAGAIDALFDALAKRRSEGAGIVGGNVKYYSAPSVDNGGAVAIDLLIGKTSSTYPSEATFCDGVLGCVMLVDGGLVRALFPHVFCGALFICTDESELSLRARSRGLRTIYIPATVGLHKSGASTSRVSRLAFYYSARNWAFLRLRYSPGLLRKVAILVSIGAYSALRLLQLRPLFIFGSLAGLGMYVTHWLDSHVGGGHRTNPEADGRQ